MLSIPSLLAPVFGLIVLGFVIGRAGYLSERAGQVLAEFGFKVAMPALLFRAAVSLSPLPVSPVSLLLVYFGASAVIWVSATLATPLLLNRPQSDAPAVAMATCFGNTVMLGIPVCLTVFGPEAATPLAILISVDTPLLWLAATIHAQWSLSSRSGVSVSAVRVVLYDLIRNPIVLSVLLGLLWRLTGLGIQSDLEKLITLLAQAALPTALFALGVTLSTFRLQGEFTTLSVICLLKLLLLPALVWALVNFVITLPPTWAAVAVLCAAMPTGANAYLFAVKYDRVVGSVSGAVLITTVLSGFTLAVLLSEGWFVPSGRTVLE